jgi:hypothetical protein
MGLLVAQILTTIVALVFCSVDLLRQFSYWLSCTLSWAGGYPPTEGEGIVPSAFLTAAGFLSLATSRF